MPSIRACWERETVGDGGARADRRPEMREGAIRPPRFLSLAPLFRKYRVIRDLSHGVRHG